jgi:hypothetical protein
MHLEFRKNLSSTPFPRATVAVIERGFYTDATGGAYKNPKFTFFDLHPVQ